MVGTCSWHVVSLSLSLLLHKAAPSKQLAKEEIGKFENGLGYGTSTWDEYSLI